MNIELKCRLCRSTIPKKDSRKNINENSLIERLRRIGIDLNDDENLSQLICIACFRKVEKTEGSLKLWRENQGIVQEEQLESEPKAKKSKICQNESKKTKDGEINGSVCKVCLCISGRGKKNYLHAGK